MLSFLHCLNLEKKPLDLVINHIYFIAKHHDKCKLALTLFQLITIPNLFSLAVVQKCQHWENLSARNAISFLHFRVIAKFLEAEWTRGYINTGPWLIQLIHPIRRRVHQTGKTRTWQQGRLGPNTNFRFFTILFSLKITFF